MCLDKGDVLKDKLEGKCEECKKQLRAEGYDSAWTIQLTCHTHHNACPAPEGDTDPEYHEGLGDEWEDNSGDNKKEPVDDAAGGTPAEKEEEKKEPA